MRHKGSALQKTMETIPETLDGKRLACGKETIDRFSRLLLPTEDIGFSINAAGWVYNHFELSVVNQNQEFVFVFEQLDQTKECFAQTDHLNIYYHGDELPRRFFVFLSKRIERYLQNVTLAHIGELVVRDSHLGRPSLPMPSAINDEERPQNLLDNWGEEDLYSNFLAEGEIARGKLDSFDIFERATTVQHCDAECMNVKPNVRARIIKLINYPWMKPSEIIGKLRKQYIRELAFTQSESEDSSMMLSTNIQENDLIFGNTEKLKRALDRAISKQDSEMIFFSNTCTPTVSGEDVHSVVKEYKKKSKVPLIYLTVTPQSMEEVFFELFVNKRLEAQKKSETNSDHKKQTGINLIGFHKDTYLDDLVDLLEQAKIHVNTVLLPEVDSEAIKKIPDAGFNVFYPNSLWSHFYDQLRIQSSQENLVLEAPYGMEGTKRWLYAIGHSVGKSEEIKSVWEENYRGYKDQWEALQKDASSYRLGFAFREEETHHFTVPSHTWGIPLLKLAIEMGFGLDVFYRKSVQEKNISTAPTLENTIPPDSDVEIKGFRSFDTMMDLFEKSECAAFFSYHFFDWRLTSSGKAIFSAQDFSIGPRGAIDSLTSLLDVCRLPFYRRYKRYLRRTYEGKRID